MILCNWDVPIRWNLTYKMFICGLRQKNTLQVFHNELAKRRLIAPLSVENRHTIKQITDLLEVFKTTITLLSGDYEYNGPRVIWYSTKFI